jgi:hypothetical protein
MDPQKRRRRPKRNPPPENATENRQPIRLPRPGFDRGGSLFTALKKRRTVREISDKKLPLELLSDLLWAACGVNRRKGPFGVPGVTAASASNSQEIELYVVLPEGAYLYEPADHRLIPAAEEDLRGMAIGPGQGKAGAKAPVRLIYVANIKKFDSAGFQEPGLHDPEIQKSYYYIDAGLIAQNVYLFAASAGLAAWFHNCDKSSLALKLMLRPDRIALFGQTVGYPAKR